MHRRLAVSFMALLALVATGCDFRLMTPPGDGPVRYRDPVFASVTKTADITYGSATDQTNTVVTLKLDLYEPTGDTVTKRPVIVMVHGGSFKSGSKTSAEIVDEATTFAKQGFVVASINYRLSPNGCTTITGECITAIRHARYDAQAAVRFMRAKATTYRLDPTRVAIGGTSAGAITAIDVAYGSDDVGTSGNPGYSSQVSAAVSLSGSKILTVPDPGEPPILDFHGTNDPLVSYSNAQNTITAARNAGLQAEITVWEGDGHVPYVAHRDQILTETTNFLWWTMHLKDAAA